MSRFYNDNSYASDPVDISLSKRKLGLFRRDMGIMQKLSFLGESMPAVIEEHLSLGDSRAAIVMQTSPVVLVAAYTDELDCIIMLRFPDFVKNLYSIEPGTHLLTVNTYGIGEKVKSDLVEGPNSFHRYCDYYPIIAEFLSDDIEVIENRKRDIKQEEWERTNAMAIEYLRTKSQVFRDGSPYYSMKPAI